MSTIHPTADVSVTASIGTGTRVWHQAQIREQARIGVNCVISKGVYIDAGVVVGNNVKVQNYVSIFHGVTIEDGVFVGPHVCFTNDLRPRAINPDGTPKGVDDWVVSETLVCRGAAIGANSTIVCGIRIGQWTMVGAGSTVTRDVPDYGLVLGNPARLRGFVCPCGAQLVTPATHIPAIEEQVTLKCTACSATIDVRAADYKLLSKVQS